MKMIQDEIEDYEQYRAAFHQVGVAHIMRQFGGVCTPIIRYNIATYPHGVGWIGETHVHVYPRHGLNGANSATANWEVLTGLAGYVAEYMCNGDRYASEIADNIELLCIYEEIDESNQEMMGDNWDESDVQQVMDIFNRDWEVLQQEVESLIHSCN